MVLACDACLPAAASQRERARAALPAPRAASAPHIRVRCIGNFSFVALLLGLGQERGGRGARLDSLTVYPTPANPSLRSHRPLGIPCAASPPPSPNLLHLCVRTAPGLVRRGGGVAARGCGTGGPPVRCPLERGPATVGGILCHGLPARCQPRDDAGTVGRARRPAAVHGSAQQQVSRWGLWVSWTGAWNACVCMRACVCAHACSSALHALPGMLTSLVPPPPPLPPSSTAVAARCT